MLKKLYGQNWKCDNWDKFKICVELILNCLLIDNRYQHWLQSPELLSFTYMELNVSGPSEA